MAFIKSIGLWATMLLASLFTGSLAKEVMLFSTANQKTTPAKGPFPLASSVLYTNDLQQGGKTVGKAYWSGVQVTPDLVNYQITMDLTKDAKLGAGKIYAVGIAASVDATADALLRIIGGSGAYANVGTNGGTLTWTDKTGTVVTLNDGWKATAAPLTADVIRFSSSNSKATPAKGPYELASSVLYTENLNQNGKVVGSSYWSGIQITSGMANYQVTISLTKDAKPYGAGTITALGSAFSVDSTEDGALAVVAGTGAYANVGKKGGALSWSASGGTVLKLNRGWRA